MLVILIEETILAWMVMSSLKFKVAKLVAMDTSGMMLITQIFDD